MPSYARAPLRYRYRRLPSARSAATRSGFSGAMGPWRSATSGEEETPRFELNPINKHWMRDGTRLERHVGAAIAWNIWRYHCVSGDNDFLWYEGGEMLIEIARFWASVAQLDHTRQRFVICGVIGPDEYHQAYPKASAFGLDNNAYTNVMAAWTLRYALDVLDRMPLHARNRLSDGLNLTANETSRWRDVSRRLYVPFIEEGIIEQFEGFACLKPFPDAPSEATREQRTDWRLDAEGDTVHAWQVCKQPDVLMLFYLLGPVELSALLKSLSYTFDDRAAAKTLDYYVSRMTHESSLSKVVCAGAFARIDLPRSWRYFTDAMQVDVTAGAGGAAEGIHLAAFGGVMDVVFRHYAGIEFTAEGMCAFPSWPKQLPDLRMDFVYHQARFALHASAERMRITSDDTNAEEIVVRHACGKSLLRPGGAVEIPIS